MKNKFITCLVALPALMSIGLTSCSNEDLVSNQQVVNRELTHVTIEASLGLDSRASLSPEGKVLKFAWNENDVIEVVNADNGECLGKMKVGTVDENNPRKCVFAGNLALPKKDAKLKLYYLGQKGSMTYTSDFKANDLDLHFSDQNGLANAMDDYDILHAEINFETTHTSFYALFSRYFSYARFILKYGDEVLNVQGKEITIDAKPESGEFYNESILNFQHGTFDNKEGAIKVTPLNANANDYSFYMTLIPSNKVELMFNVTVDDVEFVGTSGSKISEGVYYSAVEGAPIEVLMKKSDGSDDMRDYEIIYHKNLGTPDESKSVTDQFKGNSSNITLLAYEATELTAADAKYIFKGWYADAECSGEALTEVIFNYDGTTTLTKDVYAKWQIDYKATLKYDGKEEVVRPKDGETKVDLPELENTEDEEFVGWKEENGNDDEAVNTWGFTEEKAQVVLVPVYKPKEYSVDLKWLDDNGAELDKQKPTAKHGETVTVSYSKENPTKDGYVFAGWVDKDTKEAAPTSITVTSNVNLVFVPSWKECTITTHRYGHGDF